MDSQFINLYIEKLIDKVGELTKLMILKDTHLAHDQQIIDQLNKRIEELEKHEETT